MNNLKKVIGPISLFTLFVVGGASLGLTAKTDLTDYNIEEAVERKLLLSRPIPSHLIDVRVSDGIVILSGTVKDILAKEKAVLAAQSVRGARSVVDQLTIAPVDQSDSEIRKNVKEALLYDRATESFEIDVNVDDGIVELSGTTQSMAEKRLAEEVAKGVKGIRGVRNNINIDFKTDRPNSEIREEIVAQLENDPYLNGFPIQVQVKNGEVTLTGKVGSVSAITHASIDAWVSGVEKVDTTQLKVRPELAGNLSKGKKVATRSDAELEAAVKDALLFDPRALSFEIDVKADDGNVVLSGAVDNLKAKNAAKQDALNTIGVRSVDNQIKVRSGDFPADSDVERRVEAALLWDPILERHAVSVNVRNNQVFLTGEVDYEFEKDRASDIASRVFGVVEVDNNIRTTRAWEWRPDEEIKASIETEFFWSPFVDGSDLTVTVESGKAIINGIVEDWAEYDALVENAWEGGAKTVETHVTFEGYPKTAISFHESPQYTWWLW